MIRAARLKPVQIEVYHEMSSDIAPPYRTYSSLPTAHTNLYIALDTYKNMLDVVVRTLRLCEKY